MKRISTSLVAAATAVSLVAAPAMAQETDTPANTPETTTTGADESTTGSPAEGEKQQTDEPAQPEAETNTGETGGKADNDQSSGKSLSSNGKFVSAIVGILTAVTTIGLIVLSNPSGINKIVDLLNQNFGLGLAHVPLPF